MSANWPNRTLFHGDNLPFLRAMNTESVDLIATDPPFNKGRDFHATPDSLAAGAKFQDRWSWERDVHEEWTGPYYRRPSPPHGGNRERPIRAQRWHGRVHVLHGCPVARHAPRSKTHGVNLSALRSHGQPLSEGRHGRDFRVAELHQRSGVELQHWRASLETRLWTKA